MQSICRSFIAVLLSCLVVETRQDCTTIQDGTADVELSIVQVDCSEFEVQDDGTLLPKHQNEDKSDLACFMRSDDETCWCETCISQYSDVGTPTSSPQKTSVIIGASLGSICFLGIGTAALVVRMKRTRNQDPQQNGLPIGTLVFHDDEACTTKAAATSKQEELQVNPLFNLDAFELDHELRKNPLVDALLDGNATTKILTNNPKLAKSIELVCDCLVSCTDEGPASSSFGEWTAHIDPCAQSSDKTYYFNDKTKQISWNNPRGLDSKAPRTKRCWKFHPHPGRDLPVLLEMLGQYHWEEVFNQASERMYFVDPKSSVSLWLSET